MYFLYVITPIKIILNLFLICRAIARKSPISNKTKIDEFDVHLQFFFSIIKFLIIKRMAFYVLFSVVPVLISVPITRFLRLLSFLKAHISLTMKPYLYTGRVTSFYTCYLILKLELMAIVIRDRH